METSLDVNWDPVWSAGADTDCSRERRAWLRATLPFVSFAHGNERELALFTGASSIVESVRLILEWGARAVIVHRGAKGCAGATLQGWIEVPAVPVVRIVNETATGDVFTAAFLLSDGMALEERLQAASAAAASHLQGTRDFVPPLG